MPHLLSRSDVAALLGVPLKALTWWVYALNPNRRYRQFEVARQNGEPRRINAPIRPLRDIQQTLAAFLTAHYKAPPQVHGYVPLRSPSTNAAPHARQQWVFRADLEDFFPSINFGRVRGLFLGFPFEFPPDVATLLAQICCHQNELPQGAPTSPVVSNLICRGMDKQIAELARSERCHYTRYADDITISTDRTVFPTSIGHRDGGTARPGARLAQIIDANGFFLNDAKTRLARRTQRQRVTGFVVNEQLNVPRDYVRSLRTLLYIWRRHGVEDAQRALSESRPHRNWPPDKPAPSFHLVVRGRVQHVGAVKGWDSTVYVSLSETLHELDPTFRPRRTPLGPRTFWLYTEGPTDVLHLRAALRQFQAQGEFLGLVLETDPSYEPSGENHLKRTMIDLPASRPTVPCICLFDRDNASLLRELDLAQRDWGDRGNGVAAMALAPPTFRTGSVCIEMLYDDETLRQEDENGRRLFLAEEFDPVNGHHRSDSCNTTESRSRALVREGVYSFEGGRSIGLSKQAFAAAVDAGTEPFTAVSFEGFRPTFTILGQAVRGVAEKVSGAKNVGA